MQESPGASSEGPRSCPVCGSLMEWNRIKGVTIEACEKHGIWLDHGEIETLLEKSERKGALRHRAAVAKANRDGKISGALFGWWSLFFDRGRPV